MYTSDKEDLNMQFTLIRILAKLLQKSIILYNIFHLVAPNTIDFWEKKDYNREQTFSPNTRKYLPNQ